MICKSLVLCKSCWLSFFILTSIRGGGGAMPERLQSSRGDASTKVEKHCSKGRLQRGDGYLHLI